MRKLLTAAAMVRRAYRQHACRDGRDSTTVSLLAAGAVALSLATFASAHAGYRLHCGWHRSGPDWCCIRDTNTRECIKFGDKADLKKELKRIRFCLKIEGHETVRTERGLQDICTGEIKP
jgi:hypothetical protein